MGLFDRFRNTESTPSAQTDGTVVLQVNQSTVYVSAEEAKDKTLAELFEIYSEELGADPSSSSRFISTGQVVPGSMAPTPGQAYRMAANSDSKG